MEMKISFFGDLGEEGEAGEEGDEDFFLFLLFLSLFCLLSPFFGVSEELLFLSSTLLDRSYSGALKVCCWRELLLFSSCSSGEHDDCD